MKGYTFEQIKLTINGKGKEKRHLIFEPKAGKKAFDRGRKIYIVSYGNAVFYVGETIVNIKTRLQGGCNIFNKFNKERKNYNGYAGYKWLDEKNKHKILTLTVVVFEDEYNDEEGGIEVEAVEGEIAFLVRNSGELKWPLFQNEIHFHNSPRAKKIAKSIFDNFNSTNPKSGFIPF